MENQTEAARIHRFHDLVAVSFSDLGEVPTLYLDPHFARALAYQLIEHANNAEFSKEWAETVYIGGPHDL